MAAYDEKGQPIQQMQQVAYPQPTTATVTTTTSSAGIDPAEQQSRTVNVSQVNLGFGVVGLLLGLTIFILNVLPIGQGIRVNTGYWSGDPNYYSFILNRSVNYYPGFWYGLLNVAGCLGVIVYCIKVISQAKEDGAFILNDSTARSTGALLATFFGIMAAVGIGAITTSAITTVVLNHDLDLLSTCNYHSNVSVCNCEGSYWVSGVQSCEYAWGTIFNMYRALTSISAVLVVIDIVISALFCGVLCCCVATTMYNTMGGPAQITVMTVPAAGVYNQPDGGYNPPAYAQEATVVTTTAQPAYAY